MDSQVVANPIHPDMLPRLDPAFVKMYNEHLAHIPPRPPVLAALRRGYSTQYSYATAPAPACAREYEEEIDGWDRYPGKIKIRVYVPHGTAPAKGWPVHLDFHGGGWVLGDLDTEAHLCRHISTRAPCMVIDIDYRLVPEHPFPISIHDSFSALRHIVTHPAHYNIDPTVLTLGGLSAGVNTALILNHLARDHSPPIPIRAIIAGTPVLADTGPLTHPTQSPYASVAENAHAPTLNWQRLKWVDALKAESLAAADTAEREQQERDVSWFRDAFTAPRYTGLADLTVIGTAECDPLRDEGEAYGRLLEEHGNRVVVRRFAGVPHPFQHMDAVLVQAREWIDDACRYVKSVQES